VGTAGHVDHGKSSLVTALTGTNPDRWLEERLRGMTLDLGFAHLRFEDGVEAGIIDVPGHERFLHNMLAGASSMELLLLVIAADEGVMPQTVEHLQILQYLNVRQTIVVVTKSDLLAAAKLTERTEEIARALRGTIAENAPLLAVSTIAGSGLVVLRESIHQALLRLPARNAAAPPYLPIDRVFSLPGHGTIVTGTLAQGQIAIGDRLKLEPSGKTTRARSLQTFGEKREVVEAGARVAINLPGIEVSEIGRGEVVTKGAFVPTDRFNVCFRPLAHSVKLLRERNAVRAYIGAAELLGTLILDGQPEDGAQVKGTLYLRKPTVAFPGMSFVVRRLSPKTLLGGGRLESQVLASDSVAPHGSMHHHDGVAASVLAVLRAHAPEPVSAAQAAREANVVEQAALETLEALKAHGDATFVERPPAYVDAAAADAIVARVLALLEEEHRSEPWAIGATSLAISREVQLHEPLLVRILASAAVDGRLSYRAGYYALPGHVPQLNAEQRAFFDALIPLDPVRPFEPVPLEAVVAAVKQSRVPGAGKAFDGLLSRGVVVKVNEDLYRGAQIVQIRARVEAFLHANRQMTMAQFRDLIGTSRKYAVPLLEWFDARGVTVRSGDYRMLRAHR